MKNIYILKKTFSHKDFTDIVNSHIDSHYTEQSAKHTTFENEFPLKVFNDQIKKIITKIHTKLAEFVGTNSTPRIIEMMNYLFDSDDFFTMSNKEDQYLKFQYHFEEKLFWKIKGLEEWNTVINCDPEYKCLPLPNAVNILYNDVLRDPTKDFIKKKTMLCVLNISNKNLSEFFKVYELIWNKAAHYCYMWIRCSFINLGKDPKPSKTQQEKFDDFLILDTAGNVMVMNFTSNRHNDFDKDNYYFDIINKLFEIERVKIDVSSCEENKNQNILDLTVALNKSFDKYGKELPNYKTNSYTKFKFYRIFTKSPSIAKKFYDKFKAVQQCLSPIEF